MERNAFCMERNGSYMKRNTFCMERNAFCMERNPAVAGNAVQQIFGNKTGVTIPKGLTVKSTGRSGCAGEMTSLYLTE